MKFGEALDLMEAGHRVARAGWNGKGMFIYLVPAASYPAQRGAAKRWLGEGAMVPYGAYLAMKTAQDNVVPWLASQTDILAKDWVSIEEEVVTDQIVMELTVKSRCPAGPQCLSLSCKLDHSVGASNTVIRFNPDSQCQGGQPSHVHPFGAPCRQDRCRECFPIAKA